MAGTFPGYTQVSSNATLTGAELIPADTSLASGQTPQTELVTPANLANFVGLRAANGNTFRNVIHGGDFTTNPFQRGASVGSISGTATYVADRWAARGTSTSSITSAQTTNTAVAGFNKSLVISRANGNTDIGVISLAQALETNNSIRLQGQQVSLSFWAAAGASFSAASSGLSVIIASGTGTDESIANLIGATWTGYASNALTLGANAAFVAGSTTLLAINTTMTRYTVTATIPAPATQVGVVFAYTPVGTAAATDNFQLMGVQLELGNMASVFEHRDMQVERALCQRYFLQVNEINSAVVATGNVAATNVEKVMLPLPVTMRAVPTITVAAGGFNFNINGSNVAVGSGFAGFTSTAQYVTLTGTATGTAGVTATLVGTSATGTIAVSADL